MWIIWRLLPVCVLGIALWRIVPAFGSGFGSLGRGQALTSINAATIANSLQGELGKAMQPGPSRPGGVMSAPTMRTRLDGCDRPYQINKKPGVIEVVSCGEDGRCGTTDDIIELVRDDGSRERLDASLKPLKPEKKAPSKKRRPSTKKSATPAPKG